MMKILKFSSDNFFDDLEKFTHLDAVSKPEVVATVYDIIRDIREKKDVEITVMGPNAVNCAMKAIAIAREYTAADNFDLVCRPEFTHGPCMPSAMRELLIG